MSCSSRRSESQQIKQKACQQQPTLQSNPQHMKIFNFQLTLACDVCRSPNTVVERSQGACQTEAIKRGWTTRYNPAQGTQIDLCPRCSQKTTADLFKVNREWSQEAAIRHGCEGCTTLSKGLEDPYPCPNTGLLCGAWTLKLGQLPWGKIAG